MPNKNIRRGPSGGGAPVGFLNRANSNDIYVDGSSGNLLIGTGTSGTNAKPILTGIDAPTTLAAAATLSAATHAGKRLVTSGTAGFTVTLPAASGSGAVYQIYIGTSLTSSSFIVQVGNASDYMRGFAFTTQDAGGPGVDWATANTGTLATESDTITWNRGTTGLATQGDYIEVIDIATNVWSVTTQQNSNGTEATPFSAAV